MGQAAAVGLHVLGQGPGGVFIDILVGPLNDLEHLAESVVGGEGVHLMGIGLFQAGGHGDQLGVVQHGVYGFSVGGQLHGAAHADHGSQLLLHALIILLRALCLLKRHDDAHLDKAI